MSALRRLLRWLRRRLDATGGLRSVEDEVRGYVWIGYLERWRR